MKDLWLIFLLSVILLVLLAGNARATVNTMTLTDEYVSNGVRVCIYEGGNRTEVIEVNASGSCPSKKTFH